MAEQQIETEVGGSVCKIERAEGDSISEGDSVLVVESMKMEIPLVSPANAKLVKLLVAVGDTVTEGQAVAIIETA
jgi:acetyl-CoA carboxylase biotin carboxyl carrier protein